MAGEDKCHLFFPEDAPD